MTKRQFYFFFHGSTAPSGVGPPHFEASRSHTSETPLSVGLLWTSDQPDAETSTWQHTTLTTDIHAPGGIRTHNHSNRAGADPRFTPRGHWDRPHFIITIHFTGVFGSFFRWWRGRYSCKISAISFDQGGYIVLNVSSFISSVQFILTKDRAKEGNLRYRRYLHKTDYRKIDSILRVKRNYVGAIETDVQFPASAPI